MYPRACCEYHRSGGNFRAPCARVAATQETGAPPDPTREVDGAQLRARIAELEKDKEYLIAQFPRVNAGDAVLRAALINLLDRVDREVGTYVWQESQDAHEALATDAGREWLEAWRASRDAMKLAEYAFSFPAHQCCPDVRNAADAVREALAKMDRLTGPGHDAKEKS